MGKENFEKYQALAERYTKALFDSAVENNNIAKIENELNEISKTFVQNPDIENFFINPTIKIEDKKEILEKSFKNKVDEKLYSFINLLIDKNRMYILSSVANLYHKKIMQMQNILEVEVASVIALDDNMKNLLIEKLTKLTNKQIQLKNVINKEIIGGLVLSFDDKVIDGSIKTQLKRLQKQLI